MMPAARPSPGSETDDPDEVDDDFLAGWMDGLDVSQLLQGDDTDEDEAEAERMAHLAK